MGWLSDIKGFFPLNISLDWKRTTIVKYHKVNTFDLTVCTPKGIIRERSFGRTDKVDFYHKKEDGSVEHTPGD